MTKKAIVQALYDQGMTSQKEIALKTGFKYRKVCVLVWQIRNPEKYKLANRNRVKRWQTANRKKVTLKGVKARREHQKATLAQASKHYQEWLLRDIQYLRDNGGEQSIRQLAEYLGRTFRAVQVAAKKFKIDLCGNKIGAGSMQFKDVYNKENIKIEIVQSQEA